MSLSWRAASRCWLLHDDSDEGQFGIIETDAGNRRIHVIGARLVRCEGELVFAAAERRHRMLGAILSRRAEGEDFHILALIRRAVLGRVIETEMDLYFLSDGADHAAAIVIGDPQGQLVAGKFRVHHGRKIETFDHLRRVECQDELVAALARNFDGRIVLAWRLLLDRAVSDDGGYRTMAIISEATHRRVHAFHIVEDVRIARAD